MFVQQFAQDQGCEQLTAHVAPEAVVFYERCGFTVIGPLTGASLFMTKRL